MAFFFSFCFPGYRSNVLLYTNLGSMLMEILDIIYSKIEEQLTVHWATVNCLPLDFILFTIKP
ncbi:hypothetical protein D8674_019938 [Pyrus ussuriensis x Pyrus communis]|uniref:Uncharacterized protein n=1 Tax=Pyrus ussuriensis x Pyrus communis TaxID=2448454 RepID=A0A5N5G955_9ROSA|nr:hypothetical protein D8674_019938 [Pyrus ussuriensis x Pyrus communis]